MQEKLLAIEEVAKRISMSERWVAARCREGSLVAVKLGKEWRISEADLEDFIKRKGIQTWR